jgi:hypothetical protein
MQESKRSYQPCILLGLASLYMYHCILGHPITTSSPEFPSSLVHWAKGAVQTPASQASSHIATPPKLIPHLPIFALYS